MPRIELAVAIGLGASGALVDVSDYADLGSGVSRSWGRDSEFEDTVPGAFSFTLDNSDGRFMPDNTTAALAAGYAAPLTEGMAVCVTRNDVPVAGTVLAIEPAFPGAESGWAQVRVSCDDMLGNAARREIGSLGIETVSAATPLIWYRLDDAVGSLASVEASGSQGPLGPVSVNPVFGIDSVPGLGMTQMSLTDPSDGVSSAIWRSAPPPAEFASIPLGSATTLGHWSGWITPFSGDTAASFTVTYQFTGLGLNGSFVLGSAANSGVLSVRFQNPGGIGTVFGPVLRAGEPHYYSFALTQGTVAGTTTLYATAYLDGVSFLGPSAVGSYVGPALTAVQAKPRNLTIQVTAPTIGVPTTAYFSNVSYTATGPIPQTGVASGATEAGRIAVISAAVPELVLDTLPADLGTAPLGAAEIQGQSALDALNDIVRAEQGEIYSETTGTLTSPDEKIKLRARDRVSAVTYTFNAETEAESATDFIRDITNAVSTVTVDGPVTSATFTDASLIARFGSKNSSEDSPLRDFVDLLAWGSDYAWRGSNVRPRASVVRIDAMTTPTDRSADLLAMVPGDRIQIAGLPSAVLGSTTWDGWLLGVDETHSLTEHTFELHLQPCLPDTGLYDTARYMAGEVLTLSSSINSSTTSISIATSDTATKFTTTGGDFPIDVIIGTERMTATACTSATPQVMTVTRGAGGTTAAAHTAGDVLELYLDSYDSLYGF